MILKRRMQIYKHSLSTSEYTCFIKKTSLKIVNLITKGYRILIITYLWKAGKKREKRGKKI